MKISNYFRRKIYGFKASNLLMNTGYKELIDIMKSETSLFDDQPNDYSDLTNCRTGDDTNKFNRVYVYRDENTYVVYYKDVRFHLIDEETEQIYRVSILGENQGWDIKPSGKKTIIDSPETKAYTVYTFCNVMMPTGRMMVDERYTKGSWDELVYNQMSHIIEYIYSFKERNKFNKLYDCKNC